MTEPKTALYAEISRLQRELAKLRGEPVPCERTSTDGPGEGSEDPRRLLISHVFATRIAQNTRIRNTCASMKLKTLGELCDHSPEELLARRNFGPKCLRWMEAVLAEHGLTLRRSLFSDSV